MGGRSPQRFCRLLPLLPSGLLLAVALNHLVLVSMYDLSAWLGAGFGMFSTLDVGDSRHFHLYAVTPSRERELVIPEALEDLEERSLALPTPARLRRLGQAMAALDATGGWPVRVELWQTRYDPMSMQPASHILREIWVEGAEPVS